MKSAPIPRTILAILTLLAGNLAWGATEKVLYTFTDFANPGGLVFDGAGNLYGTTNNGGPEGYGYVYELSPSSYGWTRTILYTFKGGTDGNQPSEYEKLIFDKHGNLYGTTILGGQYALGNVFKLTPRKGGGWTESVIYSFNGAPAAFPESGLIFDSAGNLYGTTYGSYSCRAGTCVGTAFELSPGSSGKWNIHILHQFGVIKNDGIGPLSVLAFDAVGNLYGTTYVGGVPNCGFAQNGCGTVFRLTPASGGGWRYHLIYRFKGDADGDRPYANVITDRAGNVFGTTSLGGKNGAGCVSNAPGCGTVFELSPNSNGTWTHIVIHTFAGYPKDGGDPQDGVIVDQAGHVFGTTSLAGAYEGGVVFELTKQSSGWHETLLYQFKDKADGANPYGGLIFDSEENLYGSGLYSNGPFGPPVVFEVAP
jgi:uncharacterized repeat protein (TIGR03803 family)